MNLLPPELRGSLPRLYAQQGLEDPIVQAKFFFPCGGGTWLVTEGQPEGADFLFFGYVIGFDPEWGYFTLRELEAVDISGIVIERDLYFEPAKFSECLRDLKSQGIKMSGSQSDAINT